MHSGRSKLIQTNPGASSLTYLDIGGTLSTLPLTKVLATSSVSYLGASSLIAAGGTASTGLSAYTLVFSSGSHTVRVVIPFIDGLAPSGTIINLATYDDSSLSAWQAAATITFTTAVAATAFSFLNHRDLGVFYHVTDSAKANTFLVSAFQFSISGKTGSLASFDITEGTTPDYAGSGDMLCWGSTSYGLFQTHMRESYPLWTGFFATFFFWIYIWLVESTFSAGQDPTFRDNKWTCWGFYSLHYLAHEDHFTTLSRAAKMWCNFTWQCTVLAAIFGTIGGSYPPIIILWSALIAWAVSIPLDFALGYGLNTIYSDHLTRYGIMLRMRDPQNKPSIKQDEAALDSIDESLYTKYFWYYLIQACLMALFWTIQVNLMQRTAWNQFYLHYYWIAAVGITFVLDHLIFDPLFSALLGSTNFYRSRGYFYDFRLG